MARAGLLIAIQSSRIEKIHSIANFCIQIFSCDALANDEDQPIIIFSLGNQGVKDKDSISRALCDVERPKRVLVVKALAKNRKRHQ